MNTKTSYTLVGIFVLALMTALIWGILWIAAGGPPRDHEFFLAYMTESVSGLSVDAPLRYRGVNVGQVKEIGLDPKDPSRVRLLLQVRKGVPIKQDTVAKLEFQGLTGIASVNLTGGSAASPPLKPRKGEQYAVIQTSPSLLVRLDSALSDLLGNLQGTAERINLLLNDENREKLSATLGHIEAITGSLASQSQRLDRIMDDVESTIGNLRAASDALPELVEKFDESSSILEKMAIDLGGAGNTLKKVGSALERTVQASGADLQEFTATALPEMSVLASELRYAAENLRRISEKLERNPSALLFGTDEPEPGPGER